MKEIVRVNKVDPQANVSNPLVDLTPDGDVIRGDSDKATLISPILKEHSVDKALRYLNGPRFIAQSLSPQEVDYDVEEHTDEVVIGKAGGEWVEYEGPLGGEGWQHTGTGEVRYQERKPTDEPTEPKVPGFIEERPDTDVPAEDVEPGDWIVYDHISSGARHIAQVESNEGESWTGGIELTTEGGGILDVKVDEDDNMSQFELAGVADSEQAARTYSYADNEKIQLGFEVGEDSEDGAVLESSDFGEGDLVTVEETVEVYDDEGGITEETKTHVGIVSDVYDGEKQFDMAHDPQLEIKTDPDKEFEVESFNLAEDDIAVSRPAGQVLAASAQNDDEITEAEEEALSQVEYYDHFRGNATMSDEQIRTTDNAIQRVVGSLHDDQVAKDIFGEGFREVKNKDMPGNGTASISRRGDDREIQLSLSENVDRDTVIHETGHLLAEMYGFAVSGDASREAKVGYEPKEPFPFDNDEEDYLLKPRDDYEPAIDGYDEGEWYQSHAGEPPEEVENLIEAANDAWRKQRDLVEDEDTGWQMATVSLGYSQVNAHETLANFHEAFQTDDPYTAQKAATAVLQHHPEFWNAYNEVFEPSYQMKKAMQNWQTFIGHQQGNETFERSIVKNDDDLSIIVKEHGEVTGKVGFGENPDIEYNGDSEIIADLLRGLPGKATVPAEWDGSISNDGRVTLSPQQQYDTTCNLLSKADTVSLEKSATETIQKEWIPYQGPRGGEGWQNMRGGEVRYGIEEPPGEVEDGYEEFVGEWGTERQEPSEMTEEDLEEYEHLMDEIGREIVGPYHNVVDKTEMQDSVIFDLELDEDNFDSVFLFNKENNDLYDMTLRSGQLPGVSEKEWYRMNPEEAKKYQEAYNESIKQAFEESDLFGEFSVNHSYIGNEAVGHIVVKNPTNPTELSKREFVFGVTELFEASKEALEHASEADSSPTEKFNEDWVPYKGPLGGEGWQRVRDGEVRYSEDVPGRVAEGYEEMAEGWGEQQGASYDEIIDRLDDDQKARYDQIRERVMAHPEDTETALSEAIELIENDKSPKLVAYAVAEYGDVTADGLMGTLTGVSDDLLKQATYNVDGYNAEMSLSPNYYSDEFKQEVRKNYERRAGEEALDSIDTVYGRAGWRGPMFSNAGAPIFHHAADLTGNERQPELEPRYDDEDLFSEEYRDSERLSAVEEKSEQTTEIFREAFGDTVTVYRGVASKDPPSSAVATDVAEQMREALDEDGAFEHEHRPAESWTTDPHYAGHYATGAYGVEGEGVVLKREIPVEQVIASSHTTEELSEKENEVAVAHEETATYNSENVFTPDEINSFSMLYETVKMLANESSDGQQKAEATTVVPPTSNPDWLHDLFDTGEESNPTEKDDDGDWVPYEGPQGGEGWQRISDGTIVYQDDPPGEIDTSVLTDGQQQDDAEQGATPETDSNVSVPDSYDESEALTEARNTLTAIKPESVGAKTQKAELKTAIQKLREVDIQEINFREAYVLSKATSGEQSEAIHEVADQKERQQREDLVESIEVGDEFDGFEVLAVGGAARDHFLGEEPEDIDLMAVPRPGEVDNPIDRLSEQMDFVDTESAFPVFFDSQKREVALPRTEESTGVGFEDFDADVVDPSIPVEEQIEIDMQRRDMTIGAIGIDARSGELYDPYNGRSDVLDREIEPVSEAFKTDPVRMLRAARFAPRFDFDVDDQIYEWGPEMQEGIRELPDERIVKELDKTLKQADNPGRFFSLLSDFENLSVSFPAVSQNLESVTESVNKTRGRTDDREVLYAAIGAGLEDDVDEFKASHKISSDKAEAAVFGSRIAQTDTFDADRLLEIAERVTDDRIFGVESIVDLVAAESDRDEIETELREALSEAVSAVEEIDGEQVMDLEGIDVEQIGDSISGEKFGEMIHSYRQDRLGDVAIEKLLVGQCVANTLSSPTEKGTSDTWVPYVGPDGGEGWQQVPDGEVRYQTDAPGDSMTGADAISDLFERDNAILDAVDRYIEENGASEEEKQRAYREIIGSYVRRAGLVEGEDGYKLDTEDHAAWELESTAESIADDVIGPESDAAEAAENLGFDKPLNRFIEPGDTIQAPKEALQSAMFTGDMVDAKVVWIGESGADVEVGTRPKHIEDLTQVTGFELQDRPDRRDIADHFDSFRMSELGNEYFGEDSPVMQNADIDSADDMNEMFRAITESLKQTTNSIEDVHDWFDTVKNHFYEMPDAREFEKFEDDGTAAISAVVFDIDDRLSGDNLGEEVRDRAEDLSDGEATANDYMKAAEDVVKEYGSSEAADKQALAEAVKERLRPHELVAGEVDDVPTEERLEKSVWFAEERIDARDYGIEGGSTTGEKMDVLKYADGSIDFATPVEAYEVISTNVVRSAYEARRNNENSPKIIEAFGGSAAKTRVIQDDNNNELIVKEGIDGQSIQGRKMDRNRDTVSGELEESFYETAAAAYFVGNRDLHPGNVFETESECVIIDHDAFGRYRGDIQDPDRIARSIAGSSSIYLQDVRKRVYDKAFKYKSGEIELPEDIADTHQRFVEQAVDKALQDAFTDNDLTEYAPPGVDKDVARNRFDSIENLVGRVSEGDTVYFYDPEIGEQQTANVSEVRENRNKVTLHTDGPADSEKHPIRNVKDLIVAPKTDS